MKKLISFLLSFVLCLSFALPAFAEDEETTSDNSTPRVMVTGYELDAKTLSPSKTATLKVTFKNYSASKSVRNIKLSISDESGDIKPEGTGTQYVNIIYAGSSYTWEVKLTAAKTAQVGEHILTVSAEYEDKYYDSYESSDSIRITVAQTVSLDYDGAMLPTAVVQDSTETVDINLMNTGKSDLYNCKIAFDIEGLESGGVVFVGEIAAGESAAGSANLRVSSDILGEVAGTITISYEDAFGKEYTKTEDVSTTIKEKVVAQSTDEEEEEDETKYPLWWLFLIVGIVAGAGTASAVFVGVRARKQRLEDEKRL